MSRRLLSISFGALLVLSFWTMASTHTAEANPCAKKNPCAAKNPCGGNPCAAKNPCGGNPCGGNPCAAKNPCGGNPCNPCGGGGGKASAEGVMLTGQVVGYKGNYLNVRSASGKTVRVHLVKTTIAHLGNKMVNSKSLRRGMIVNISTQAKGNYYKANFIYARGGGGGNPCNPCGGNPCAANPCAAKNPCGGNPCAAKNPCGGNPCARKNPCGR